MAKLALPRHILPFVAIAALALRGCSSVATTQPDRRPPARQHAAHRAPPAQAGAVSGAGVVEPSSELIEVGAQRAGVVTSLAVQPGRPRRLKGQLLFTIDARDARRGSASAGGGGLARERVDAGPGRARRRSGCYALYTNVERSARGRRAAGDRPPQRARPGRGAARSRAAELARRRRRRRARAPRSGLLEVRAPRSATVLQVNTRVGQYATAGPGRAIRTR
jgi:HlyD family secretion protein